MRFPGLASIASILLIGVASGAAGADDEVPGGTASDGFEVVVVRGASVYLASRGADGHVREVTLREDPRPAPPTPRSVPRPADPAGESVTIVIQNAPPRPRYVVVYVPARSSHAGFFRHEAFRYAPHRSVSRHRVKGHAGGGSRARF